MVLSGVQSPQRTSIYILGLVGLSVYSEWLYVIRIQESRNLETWGQGSNLEMRTMGRDPELKLPGLESTLVCQVVGMQVCWVVSRATLLCCLDTSCQ